MANNETHVPASNQEVNHEPMPLKVYIGVFLGLLVLTFVTVWIAQFSFGDFNMVVAMAVAVCKAMLVILYFMNLKADHDRINGVIFMVAFFFLLVFIGPSLWDKATRGSVDPVRGEVTPSQPLPSMAPGTEGGGQPKTNPAG